MADDDAHRVAEGAAHRAAAGPGPSIARRFRNPGALVRYYVTVGRHVVEVDADGASARVVGAVEEARALERGGGPALTLSVGNRPHRVYAARRGESIWEIHFRGRSFEVEVVDEARWRICQVRGDGGGADAGQEPLRAPMPGLVLRVDVEEGQEIAEGQGLLIVEAMKMENELRARSSARILRIHAEAGQSVRRGDLLIEFEQAGDPDGAGDGRRP